MWIIWQIKVRIWIFFFIFFRNFFLGFLSELVLFIFVFLIKITNIIFQLKYLLIGIIYSCSNNNFFFLLPEIFLVICLLMLIVYLFIFPIKFDNYHLYFLLVTVFILSFLIFLINIIYFFNKFPICLFDNFIVIDYQVYCSQVSILYVSIFCLVLYRRILTRSVTNCLIFLFFYLLATLVGLIIMMVNIIHIYSLVILLEILSICFYLLASFNYTGKGYLIFRFLPIKKIFFFSSILGLFGIIFIEIQSYLDYIYIFDHFIYCHYLLILLKKGQYFYKWGFLLILGNFLFKFLVFYGPTDRIYYEKTPTISIVYMHLIPKMVILSLIFKLLLSDFFIYNKVECNFIFIILGLFCLIISIGMRRVFLKNYMEYLALVHSGYLLLCLSPLTYTSIYLSIYYFFFYIFLILGYGGILLYYDIDFRGGHKISFDTIYCEQEYGDFCTIIIPLIVFVIVGLPPTRKDYPCSRGIPFNGLIFQCLLSVSLLNGEIYLLLLVIIIFNFIVFLFFSATVIPFWFNKLKEIQNFKIFEPPRSIECLDKYIIELIFFYLCILIFVGITFNRYFIIFSMQTYIF